MNQISPGEFFPINWNVSDPEDTTLYYPQAVIKNSRTKALIKSLDMVTDDNRMYRVQWQALQDGSGFGYYVDITVSVYTDAGHTTLNPDYQIESDTYLVQQRPNTVLGMGYGGGDGGIDLERLRNIIKEIVKPLENRLSILPVEKNDNKEELKRIRILEELLSQLCESMTYNEGQRAEENEKLVKKIDNYDENTSKMIEYIGKLDGQNADAYEAMVKIVKEHANQSKKYVDGQLYKFGEDMKQFLSEIFDNIQVVQMTSPSRGIKHLAEKENSMDKYTKIAQGLV